MSLLLAGMGAFAVNASANAQGVAIIGEGLQSCGAWTTARTNQSDSEKAAWVLGYLSGIGFSGSQLGLAPLHDMDGETVLAWIDTYCRTHPASLIANAGGAFVQAHPHGR
jgi:hypothetical protein